MLGSEKINKILMKREEVDCNNLKVKIPSQDIWELIKFYSSNDRKYRLFSIVYMEDVKPEDTTGIPKTMSNSLASILNIRLRFHSYSTFTLIETFFSYLIISYTIR